MQVTNIGDKYQWDWEMVKIWPSSKYSQDVADDSYAPHVCSIPNRLIVYHFWSHKLWCPKEDFKRTCTFCEIGKKCYTYIYSMEKTIPPIFQNEKYFQTWTCPISVQAAVCDQSSVYPPSNNVWREIRWRDCNLSKATQWARRPSWDMNLIAHVQTQYTGL